MRVQESEAGKDTEGARVLVVGVAYKEDVGDTRESPALKTIELLAERGAQVSYTDSFVGRVEVAGRDYSSVPLDKSTLEQVDCVVIITAHSDVDLELLGSLDIPVVDTRNALRRAGLQWR